MKKEEKYDSIVATFKAWDDEYCASGCVCAYLLKWNIVKYTRNESSQDVKKTKTADCDDFKLNLTPTDGLNLNWIWSSFKLNIARLDLFSWKSWKFSLLNKFDLMSRMWIKQTFNERVMTHKKRRLLISVSELFVN